MALPIPENLSPEFPYFSLSCMLSTKGVGLKILSKNPCTWLITGFSKKPCPFSLSRRTVSLVTGGSISKNTREFFGNDSKALRPSSNKSPFAAIAEATLFWALLANCYKKKKKKRERYFDKVSMQKISWIWRSNILSNINDFKKRNRS